MLCMTLCINLFYHSVLYILLPLFYERIEHFTMNDKVPRLSLGMISFLGILSALGPLAIDMYLPALPSMPVEFKTSMPMIQLSLTATILGMAVGQIFGGPMSDMWGRKRPLIWGMGIFSIASLICVWASTIKVFLMARLLQGLAGAIGIVVSKAMARDLAGGSELTKIVATLMMINGLAPILSPVIGGQVLLFTSWRGVFVLMLAVGIFLVHCVVKVQETLPVEKRLPANLLMTFKTYGALLKNSYFMGFCLVQSFSFVMLFAYISGSSFVFQGVYNVSPQMFSLIFGVNGAGLLLCNALTRRLTGYIEDIRLLRWSLSVSCAGSFILLIGFWMNSSIWIILTILFITLSAFSMMGATSFSLAMHSQSKNAGSAAALLGFFATSLGAITGPLVGMGDVVSAIPMSMLMFCGELMALLSFLVLVVPGYAKLKKINR